MLRRNQNSFQRNQSTSQILTIHWIIGVHAKNLKVTLLLVDFSKAFDSIHRGNMEQILLAYGLPKETVTAIMMLYCNTKVKVHSSDGNTDFFDIIAGVLKRDILAPYLFIIFLNYVLRTSIDLIKENGLTLKKAIIWYSTKALMGADYADNNVLLANNLPEPNSCCIAWSRQQEAWVPMWMQPK